LFNIFSRFLVSAFDKRPFYSEKYIKILLPLEKQERPACFQISSFTTYNPEGKKRSGKVRPL
jgi:hypothetical protein